MAYKTYILQLSTQWREMYHQRKIGAQILNQHEKTKDILARNKCRLYQNRLAWYFWTQNPATVSKYASNIWDTVNYLLKAFSFPSFSMRLDENKIIHLDVYIWNSIPQNLSGNLKHFLYTNKNYTEAFAEYCKIKYAWKFYIIRKFEKIRKKCENSKTFEV